MRRPFLSPATFTDRVKRVPTRNGYGEGVVAAGKKNGNVVVLCADLSESTRSDMFRDAFPDRFIQLGVSEQSMAAIAGGLALEGKIPFIASYATFSPGRNLEQIRMCAAIQNVPIKIVGCHTGVSVGPDGATHQALEDIATMRVLPNMTV
ncbi:MAG: transketolase family protein, partial [Patescibacteria group bacterium]